jgi:hypothetical protein
MTMTRLEDMTVQSKEASLVLPAECVCGAGSNASARLAQPAVVPTCTQCGGSLLRLSEPAGPTRQERRRLQDFLSAFV